MPGFFAYLFGRRKRADGSSGVAAPQARPTPPPCTRLIDVLRNVPNQEIGFAFDPADYAKRQKVEITVRGYNTRSEYPDYDLIPDFNQSHADKCEGMTRLAFTGLSDHQKNIFLRLLNRTGWKKIHPARVDSYTDYLISGDCPHEPKIEEASIYGVEVMDFWMFVRMALRQPVDWTNERNALISERTLERLKAAGGLDEEILNRLTEEDAKVVLSEV